MRYRVIPIIILAILIIVYWPTFQTIPNGSSHSMMMDVGETQVVLNTWGTLHPTGYPHYVISGNLLVGFLKLLGISAAAAASSVSLLWGLLALAVFYLMTLHLTYDVVLAAALVLIFGLTRFVWVHNVVAEIYSMALLLLMMLFALAIWKEPFRYRIELMALVGGIGVAHYRGIALLVPGLIYAVWPQVWPEIRQRPWKIGVWLGIALLGFVPYIYLPLRADAVWAYGDLDTWDGFWQQFNATEFNYLFGWPDSFEQFSNNFDRINELLQSELSIYAIAIGIVGLIGAAFSRKYHRVSIMLIISALTTYGFSTALYYEILATLILTITVSLALGWVFLIVMLLSHMKDQERLVAYGLVGIVALGFGIWLHDQNADWIHDLTHDRSGLETIELAEQAPVDSTLMLSWGPRYFALGFAQDVEHKLQHIDRADHRADFASIVANGMLVTPEYTFYNQPPEWWQNRIGKRIYLRAVAPYLVQIDTEPVLATEPYIPETVEAPVAPLRYEVRNNALYVDWIALEKPTRNLSVFVHLLDENGERIGQADMYAPVYSRRPLTDWEVNEIVSDVYPFPTGVYPAHIRFGLYEQLPNKQFANYYETELEVAQ